MVVNLYNCVLYFHGTLRPETDPPVPSHPWNLPGVARTGCGIYYGGRTVVSLKFLDDFFGLQVPEVDHVVLRARHDPLRRETENNVNTQQEGNKQHNTSQNAGFTPTHHFDESITVMSSSASV